MSVTRSHDHNKYVGFICGRDSKPEPLESSASLTRPFQMSSIILLLFFFLWFCFDFGGDQQKRVLPGVSLYWRKSIKTSFPTGYCPNGIFISMSISDRIHHLWLYLQVIFIEGKVHCPDVCAHNPLKITHMDGLRRNPKENTQLPHHPMQH